MRTLTHVPYNMIKIFVLIACFGISEDVFISGHFHLTFKKVIYCITNLIMNTAFTLIVLHPTLFTRTTALLPQTRL